MDTQHTPASGRCFTLVELLVVIAIIALLASLLLPALRSARDRAESVTCQSNLHTQAMALQMYCADANGRIPLAWHSPLDTEIYGGAWWPYGGVNPSTYIFPYIGSVQSFMCPSFEVIPGLCCTEVEEFPPQLVTVNGQAALIYPHYRPNPYLGCCGYGPGSFPSWNADATNPRWWTLANIDNASEKIFQVDGLRTHSPYGSSPQYANNNYWLNSVGDGDRGNPFNYGPVGGNYGAPNMGAWHMHGTNAAFLDGHVAWHPTTSTTTFHDFDDEHWALP